MSASTIYRAHLPQSHLPVWYVSLTSTRDYNGASDHFSGQMILASHKRHLVTCAEATCQVSDKSIIKLAQSETIKHDS